MDHPEPEDSLTQLRRDLSAVTMLLELLYSSQFRSTPDGADRFKALRKRIMERTEIAMDPNDPTFEAGASDLGSSMLAILNRIEDRIAGRLR